MTNSAPSVRDRLHVTILCPNRRCQTPLSIRPGHTDGRRIRCGACSERLTVRRDNTRVWLDLAGAVERPR